MLRTQLAFISLSLATSLSFAGSSDYGRALPHENISGRTFAEVATCVTGHYVCCNKGNVTVHATTNQNQTADTNGGVWVHVKHVEDSNDAPSFNELTCQFAHDGKTSDGEEWQNSMSCSPATPVELLGIHDQANGYRAPSLSSMCHDGYEIRPHVIGTDTNLPSAVESATTTTST